MAAIALALGCALTAAVAPAAGAAGRFPCNATPPNYSTNGSGAAIVSSPLAPLPAPVPGAALYPRVNGHIPAGFSDTAFDKPASCTATQETAARYAGLMGASVVRTTIDWPTVQQFGPGGNVWGRYDHTYDAFVSQGIRPLWIIQQSPRWAAADTGSCNNTNFCKIGPGYTHMQEFGAFVAAVARRYPLAAGVEIWNEPNMKWSWGANSLSNPDPVGYAQMVVAAHDAIENPAIGNPAMRLVVGALCGGCGDALDGSVLSPKSFISRMYVWLKGVNRLDVYDAFSTHPYPHDAGDGGRGGAFVPALQNLVSALRDEGVALPRLLVTEIGATTGPSAPASIHMTPEQQQSVMLADYQALDDQALDGPAPDQIPAAGNWDAVMFYGAVEGYTDVAAQTPVDGGFGWLYQQDASGAHVPKPVYCAFAALLGGSSNCTPIPAVT